ncbi:MAG TPA: hypothetical protein VIR98_00575 [Candidatus Paceibacterota bacterium]|jgi:hypothetical protein
MEKKLWFRAKRFGWGWVPVTWQGWAVTVAYIAIMAALASAVKNGATAKEYGLFFLLPGAIITTTLIRICYAFGEKPRMRWGGEEKKEEK